MKFNDLFKVTNNFKFLNKRARYLLKTYHYKKSYRSLQQVYVFHLRLKSNNRTMGVAVYGNPMCRYHNKNLELRRLVLVKGAPKHLTGWFLSKTLKEIKKLKQFKQIITFSDPNIGHKGTIYKATNWIYNGKEKTNNPRSYSYQGIEIHQRQIYAKNKYNQYTPSARYYQELLKENKIVKRKLLKKDKFIFNL